MPLHWKISLLSLLTLLQIPVQAANLFVSVYGNDAAAGTASQPWRTIQHAADVVNPGDTVTVSKGVYGGFQVLRSGEKDRPIRFQTAPGEEVTIEDKNAGILIGENGNSPKTIVSYVEVSGFHVQGGANTWNGALAANGTVGVIFRRNVIEDTQGNHGILVFNSHGFLIAGNTVRKAGIMGIRAARSYQGIIRDNKVSGGGFQMVGDDGSGIYVNGSHDITVSGNQSTANKGNGILTELSDNLTLQNNNCVSNGWAGIWIDSARASQVKQNLCRDNGGGIWASQTQGGVVSDLRIIANVCDSNNRMPSHATRGAGIWIRDGANVTIMHNVVCRNGSSDNPGSGGIFLGVYWGSDTEIVKNTVIRNNICVGNEGSQLRVMPNQLGRNNVADHNDLLSEASLPAVIWGLDKFPRSADWQRASGQGTGTISVDPRFVNSDDPFWLKRDFHLRPDSPCRRAGARLSPTGHAPDMGLYGLDQLL